MQNFTCPVLVKEVNGSFYIICETFNIVAKDKDLSVAYAELKKLRNNILERFREMGLSPPEQRDVEQLSLDNRFGLLQRRSYSFLQSLIVLGIFLIFLIGITIPILNAMNGVLKPLENLSAKLAFLSLSEPAELSKMLAKAANVFKEITPQKKEELHLHLKTIVNELEPFVDDVRPLMLEKQNSKSTNE